jgi:hypothetical protein
VEPTSESPKTDSTQEETQQRQAEDNLERLLLEGLHSEAIEVTPACWDAFRARLATRPSRP